MEGDAVSKWCFAYVKYWRQRLFIDEMRWEEESVSSRVEVNELMVPYFEGILGVRTPTSLLLGVVEGSRLAATSAAVLIIESWNM